MLSLEKYDPTPAASTTGESEFSKGFAAGRAAENRRVAGILALSGDTSKKTALAIDPSITLEAAKEKLAPGASASAGSWDDIVAQINRERGFGERR